MAGQAVVVIGEKEWSVDIATTASELLEDLNGGYNYV